LDEGNEDDKEIWISIEQDNWGGNTYYLWIIEKAAMKQEVTANAKFMSEGISSTGHVAVYGIYFDFNKSDVKPESDPALQEITSSSPTIHPQGVHCGPYGQCRGVDFNMKLSQVRADCRGQGADYKYKINPNASKPTEWGNWLP